MRAVVQVVQEASVTIEGERVSEIGTGFLIYLGVGPEDTEETARKLWKKIRALRIFPDANGKTNLNLDTVQGSVLIVSQFTLYASLHHGNRPSFVGSAAPDLANALYEFFVSLAREEVTDVQTGHFGADMKVASINHGPFTLWIDTDTL